MKIRVSILTISDRSSKGERPDLTGPLLLDRIRELGWVIDQTHIVPDDLESIKQTLTNWCDHQNADLILTNGGTGFSPRDVTPEATDAVIHKKAPGLAEAMRTDSLKITPHAMLSRATAGIRGKTLIVNLPGSPKGAIENLNVIVPVIPHAIELLQESESAEAHH